MYVWGKGMEKAHLKDYASRISPGERDGNISIQHAIK